MLELAAEAAATIKADWQIAETSEEKDELWAWYKQSQMVNRQKAMVELVKGNRQALAEPEEFDANRLLISVANGTIDLTTGKLSPHRPADMLTQATSVAYNEKATAPRWGNSSPRCFPTPTFESSSRHLSDTA